jgi:zinc/manganese transport system substrate-binding protein
MRIPKTIRFLALTLAILAAPLPVYAYGTPEEAAGDADLAAPAPPESDPAAAVAAAAATPQPGTFAAMPRARDQKLRVVASFSILGDLVKAVGGKDVEVTTLIGPNGDAHVYEPKQGDARTLYMADVIVVNGLGLEGWIDRMVAASGTRATVVTASKGAVGLDSASSGLAPDPHAWQSVANGKIYVANIRDALVAADPADKEAYTKNAADYSKQLDVLDVWIREQIARVPEVKRKAITPHDAFHYFGEAYGVLFMSPLGTGTDGDASDKRMALLTDRIQNQKVKALFTENVGDPRLIRQLQAQGQAYEGGMLYSDALSPPDGPAPDYISMFRSNVMELTKGMMFNN